MTTAEIIVSLWAGTRGYLDKAWKPSLPTHTILQRAFRISQDFHPSMSSLQHFLKAIVLPF